MDSLPCKEVYIPGVTLWPLPFKVQQQQMNSTYYKCFKKKNLPFLSIPSLLHVVLPLLQCQLLIFATTSVYPKS